MYCILSIRGCAVVACSTPDLCVIDPRSTASVAVAWQHTCSASSLLCLSARGSAAVGGGSCSGLLVGDERGQLSLYDLRAVHRGVLWSQLLPASDVRATITDLQVQCTQIPPTIQQYP